MKKTSKDWYELIQGKESGFVIMDPDGWDRKNYDYSFNQELVTLVEFKMRSTRSTTLGRIGFDLFKIHEKDLGIL